MAPVSLSALVELAIEVACFIHSGGYTIKSFINRWLEVFTCLDKFAKQENNGYLATITQADHKSWRE